MAYPTARSWPSDAVLSLCAVRQDDAGSECSGLAALGALRLDIAARWPLPLVLQDVGLQQYNAVFAVLLQVHVLSFHALCSAPAHSYSYTFHTFRSPSCHDGDHNHRYNVQVRVASKALNGVYNRWDRGMDRAGCLAMSMRHFLGAYLAHVMGHLVHSCVPQLQRVSLHRLEGL